MQHIACSQKLADAGAGVNGEHPFGNGRERPVVVKSKRRGEHKSGGSFQWAVAGLVLTTLLATGGGWVRDLQADGDVESQPGPSPPGSDVGSLVGEEPPVPAPPKEEYDFDYSESSGSLLGSARWSGQDRPGNGMLGNYTRPERDIARVDAVLAGARPVPRRIARFEHASLGVSNLDERGNVWNVSRGFDLRDLHRIELDEEPAIRMFSPDEHEARRLRELGSRGEVEADCRSNNISDLRSDRSRDWFHGPYGPRQTPLLGVYNRYQWRYDIIRDEYISRGWCIFTGASLVDAALSKWGRPSEAESHERVVVNGHPRLRPRVPVRIWPYDNANYKESVRSTRAANREAGYVEVDGDSSVSIADRSAAECSRHGRPSSPRDAQVVSVKRAKTDTDGDEGSRGSGSGDNSGNGGAAEAAVVAAMEAALPALTREGAAALEALAVALEAVAARYE